MKRIQATAADCVKHATIPNRGGADECERQAAVTPGLHLCRRLAGTCRGAEATLGWLTAKSVFHGVVDGEVDVDKDAASRAQV